MSSRNISTISSVDTRILALSGSQKDISQGQRQNYYKYIQKKIDETVKLPKRISVLKKPPRSDSQNFQSTKQEPLKTERIMTRDLVEKVEPVSIKEYLKSQELQRKYSHKKVLSKDKVISEISNDEGSNSFQTHYDK